jgi:hypothetical protein
MATTTSDIQWRTGMEEALAVAHALRRPLALKPMGQGMGDKDDW